MIVVIDYYSTFFEAGLLKSTKTDKVVEFLDTIFCRFGYPQALRTDNGPQFISGEFRLYLETHGIHWVCTINNQAKPSSNLVPSDLYNLQ